MGQTPCGTGENASVPFSYVALPLPEAMEALEARRERVAAVLVTGPPGGRQGKGVPRVVRERRCAEGLELTVAFPSRTRHDGTGL
jgi:hypothetical protein